ncbi:hypothetical protein ACHLPL_15500 (plasmid) [Enterococcus faecalis]
MKKKISLMTLTKAVNGLFSLVFDYDSSNKEQTVAKKSNELCDRARAIRYIRDVDKVVPSVVTVSH